jgi:hypothetical protein
MQNRTTRTITLYGGRLIAARLMQAIREAHQDIDYEFIVRPWPSPSGYMRGERNHSRKLAVKQRISSFNHKN